MLFVAECAECSVVIPSLHVRSGSLSKFYNQDCIHSEIPMPSPPMAFSVPKRNNKLEGGEEGAEGEGEKVSLKTHGSTFGDHG